MGMGFGLSMFGTNVIWGLVCLFAAILAFRGRSYWATRLMLVGSSLQLVGGLIMVAGMFFVYRSIGGPYGGGPTVSAIAWMVLSVLGPAGTLVFLIGMIGLCMRFGAVERRAAELETLTQQLGARLQE